MSLDVMKRRYARRVLESARHNQTLAARILDISRHALRRLIDDLPDNNLPEMDSGPPVPVSRENLYQYNAGSDLVLNRSKRCP